MFCYISGVINGGFVCPKADGPECSIFFPAGVKIRNKRCTCNYKDMRNPVGKDGKAKKKVNPLKASKRGK
jgi:hypothetical protein